jgi:hypothetical protein
MTLLTKLSNKQPLQHALMQAIGADTVVNKLDDVVSFLVNFMTESPHDEDIISTRDSIFCSVVRTSRCSSEKSLLSLGRLEALRSSLKAPLVMPLASSLSESFSLFLYPLAVQWIP